MGLFWDLIQQYQIEDQKDRASSIEERLRLIESNLQATRDLLYALIQRLEKHFGEDIDKDGRVG